MPKFTLELDPRKWFRKKEAELPSDKGNYQLQKMSPKGGWEKVESYTEEIDIEGLYKNLDPGKYRMIVYRKGTPGFDPVWGPVSVTGNDEEEAKTPREKKDKGGSSALVQWVEMAKAISSLREEAGAEFAAVAPMFGFTNTNDPANKPLSLVEQLKRGKDDYELLRSFFGEKVSGDEPIKYEGSVPIWLHPKLIPVLIDDTLEKVEKRLGKWGVIEEEKSAAAKEVEEQLPDFPAKPKSEKKVDDTKTDVEKASKKEEEEEKKKEE